MSINQTGANVPEATAPVSEVNMEAQPEQAKEQYVPLSALQSERAQRQQREQELAKREEDLRMIKDHLALLQANQQQPKQSKDEFDGLEDSDVLTVGEAKKFMANFNRQHQLSLEELRMTQKYPDYQEVVTRYLPEVLNANPRLVDSLRQTQDYELAYYLAKNSDSYKSENKKKKINADAERIVQNSQSTGSLSSIGSTSPISHVKRYKDMSDADFMREVNRNLGYA